MVTAVDRTPQILIVDGKPAIRNILCGILSE
jgi:hypothetical protein